MRGRSRSSTTTRIRPADEAVHSAMNAEDASSGSRQRQSCASTRTHSSRPSRQPLRSTPPTMPGERPLQRKEVHPARGRSHGPWLETRPRSGHTDRERGPGPARARLDPCDKGELRAPPYKQARIPPGGETASAVAWARAHRRSEDPVGRGAQGHGVQGTTRRGGAATHREVTAGLLSSAQRTHARASRTAVGAH
jgi:hypothetical protein